MPDFLLCKTIFLFHVIILLTNNVLFLFSFFVVVSVGFALVTRFEDIISAFWKKKIFCGIAVCQMSMYDLVADF
jgi:hypothetical protein